MDILQGEDERKQKVRIEPHFSYAVAPTNSYQPYGQKAKGHL